jgi:hypothetical protein
MLQSGTLLIFKVKGQGVKFLGEGIRHALRCPCLICIAYKKSLKISKELFEALNQNRTDNAMAKRKSTSTQKTKD